MFGKILHANDGSEPAYSQGSPVSMHLPVESLRVLPEAPEPAVDGEGAAGEGTDAGADLGRAAATVILPPPDTPAS